MGAEVRIGLSEFEAIKDAKKKAEDELKESKQSHKEEISDLKNTIKEIEKRARVIIKHNNKYFYKTAFDRETIKKLKNSLIFDINYGSIDIDRILHNHYFTQCEKISTIVDIIVEKINKYDFVEASDEIKEQFSENGDPDQYIGFDDIKLEVEKELKDQYINNQKKIQENLEQQIKDYENKYQRVEADVKSKYNSKIRILEDKLNSSQEYAEKLKETHKEEVDKLNETHKEEVDNLKEDIDKLKDELKEAQKTQEEKILDAEEKLKEAQEVLEKLTNTPRKKRWIFWK
jgi:DNA anti-recombination protein RmuC